jgi:hypothetical protein
MGSIAAAPAPDMLESANRVEPGSFPLSIAKYPEAGSSKLADADNVATKWVESFNQIIAHPNLAALSDIFLQESYWRDQLCLSWDFRTLNGPEKMIDLLEKENRGCRIKSIALDKTSALRCPKFSTLDADGTIAIMQAFLTVETDVGSGSGVVRLAQEQGVWKAFTLFTMLKELKGFEPLVGGKRPFGVQHGEHESRQNWLDRRKVEEGFQDGQDPTVLIVGT